MSATVFYYPSSYVQIVDQLRSRVLAGKPASWANNIKIGTSTNFNKLCGCVLQVGLHCFASKGPSGRTTSKS